jgi:hypothetical protein
MAKRIGLSILLAIQVLGGGAVTLAHARDVVVARPGVEASHSARCAILHDELRCALCHYASAHVVTQQPMAVPEVPTPEIRVAVPHIAGRLASTFTTSSSPRAPPALS